MSALEYHLKIGLKDPAIPPKQSESTIGTRGVGVGAGTGTGSGWTSVKEESTWRCFGTSHVISHAATYIHSGVCDPVADACCCRGRV